MLRAWLSQYPRASTRARKVAALRRIDAYLRRVKKLAGLPWRPATPRLRPMLPKALPETQLLSLLEKLDEMPDTFPLLRDRLLLELLYGCGLRRSEALTLKIEHIHGDTIHILGKGNKWRVLPLYPRLGQLLRRYLEMRAQIASDHTYVLCTDKGSPLYPRAAYAIVRRYAGTHPHALRHSFATHLLRNGANVQAVRDLLGHESLATTQKYLALSPEDLKAAYKKFHPRA